MKDKMYVVDGSMVFNFNDLKFELMKEIHRDTLENSDDKDILGRNLDLILAVSLQEEKSEDFIIKELGQYGVSVMKVEDLCKNLEVLRHFYINTAYEAYCKDIEKVLEEIKETILN